MRSWAVWLLALVLIVGGVGASFHKLRSHPAWMQETDLALYVHAARAIANGDDPYDYRIYYEGRSHKYFGVELPKGDPYAYSPGLAELVAPLLGLGRGFRYFWWLFNLAAISGAVLLLLRRFGTRVPWPWACALLGVLLAGRMVQTDLFHGQANLLLIFVLALGLLFLADGRELAAGLLFAIAVSCKPFLGVLVLYLAWRRAWRTAAVACAGTVAIEALSFLPALLGGRLSLRGWLDTSHYYSSAPLLARPDYQALYSLFFRLFSRDDNPFTVPWVDQPWLVAVGLLLFGCPVAWLVARAIPMRPLGVLTGPERSRMLLEVGVVLALTLALGPLAQGDYALFLLPGLVGALIVTESRVRERAATQSAWLWALGLWLLAFLPVFLPWRLDWGLPSADDWQPLGGSRILLTGRVGVSFWLAALGLSLALLQDARMPARKMHASAKDVRPAT